MGRNHVLPLMRKMSIEAMPHPSKPRPAHKVCPYLLRGLNITKANAVWCSDVTYIPMTKRFCCLVAMMDWASRKVLPFRESDTLDTPFYVEAPEEALRNYGTPIIFNADQGSQFTSLEFTDILTNHNTRISRMDGQGRWRDNNSSSASGRP